VQSAGFIIAFHNIFPSCVGYTRVAFASGNKGIAACISGYIHVDDELCWCQADGFGDRIGGLV